MAKFTLELDDDFNYGLIGICSHNADYRVCWSINTRMSLQLEKSDNPFLVYGKKGVVASTHSMYEWHDDQNGISYYLLQNKDKETGSYLIPEKNQVDFFLVIDEADSIELEYMANEIKDINCVLTAMTFEMDELKSADRLVFD